MSALDRELLEIITELENQFLELLKVKAPIKTLSLDQRSRIETLLKAGADPYIPNKSGYSPLRVAIYIGNEELMKLLVDQGLRLNEREQKAGKRAPHMNEYFQYLLEKCDKIAEMTPEAQILWLETSTKDYQDVDELLKSKRVNIKAVDSSGKTLLHIAAENSTSEVVEVLLQNGAIVDARDKKNLTPLCYAVRADRRDNSISLVRHGADPEVYVDGMPCGVYSNRWHPYTKREFHNAVVSYDRNKANISMPSSNGNAQTPAQLLASSLSQVTSALSLPSVPQTEDRQSPTLKS